MILLWDLSVIAKVRRDVFMEEHNYITETAEKKWRRLLGHTEQIINNHITWIIHVCDPVGT